MNEHLVLLSIPGLREKDLRAMPNLQERMAGGGIADLIPSFPCVTCPVHANMTTGCLPRDHGIVGNGIYWRDRQQIEMWTSPNDCIERPQIWDLLSHQPGEPTSAVWFAMHSIGCEADYVCTPKPIHNPDGSESLWCYTRPLDLYGRLRDELGHFPLMHFWGPAANIHSSDWIARSAVSAAHTYHPNFFMIYLPHLDYAAQRSGPDSPPAQAAATELDEVLGRLFESLSQAYTTEPVWLVAGEYAITPVSHVVYPNRILREAGLLAVRPEDDGEHLDLAASRAWALADHQFSHVFVRDADPTTIRKVADRFTGLPGIAEVLAGDDRGRYDLDHPRSGEVILISAPDSWQAYYYWLSEDQAPAFARTVDIHRKPGYDPVELFFDHATHSIPLDASLVHGSHGAPARDISQRSVLLASQPTMLLGPSVADVDVFQIILRHFGLAAPVR